MWLFHRPLVRFVVHSLCQRPHLVPRDEAVAVEIQPPKSRPQSACTAALSHAQVVAFCVWSKNRRFDEFWISHVRKCLGNKLENGRVPPCLWTLDSLLRENSCRRNSATKGAKHPQITAVWKRCFLSRLWVIRG